ncbi:MAG: AAA family ATPase [Clostridiales bacterium]|nr:AAA family ATPase [Clostridiales bacterium]
MEIINLAIFSRDQDYGLALGEALSVQKNNFIVEVCKDEQELSKIAKFDLLLYDCEGSGASSFPSDKRAIKLTGCRADAALDIDNLDFTLYKYSKVQELCADIALYYSLLTGKANYSMAGAESKIIAFCSSKGGVGKTTVAFGTAQALRRHGSKSVLYVSMEEIESTLLYIKGRGDGPGLCEYLYHLLKPNGKKPDSEAFMISDKHGVHAFMPDKGANRLRELDVLEMAQFFKEISGSGAWDYILVDMGECFGEEVSWVFSACHKIAVVLPSGRRTDERESRFMDYLRFTIGEGGGDKLVEVRNKALDREGAMESEGAVYVDFDSDSIDTGGETVDISIDQDFGSGVRELMKKIM